MGRPKEPYDREFRGTIDKLVVVRQNKVLGTIWSSYPDMSNIKPSELQLKAQDKFRRAQIYALQLLSNPEIKAYYKQLCQGGQRPHNILTSELMKGIKPFPSGEEKQS